MDLTSVAPQGEKVVTVHHTKAERDGKTLDVDETIEFTFTGDRISRLSSVDGGQHHHAGLHDRVRCANLVSDERDEGLEVRERLFARIGDRSYCHSISRR